MCWALLCSLTRYFLKIHLGLIDHQSQLRSLRKVLKDRACASREEVKLQNCYDTAELQKRHTVILLDHNKLITLCSYIKYNSHTVAAANAKAPNALLAH